MLNIATDLDVPTFTTADVAVRVDRASRAVSVIPDDVARVLRRAGKTRLGGGARIRLRGR